MTLHLNQPVTSSRLLQVRILLAALLIGATTGLGAYWLIQPSEASVAGAHSTISISTDDEQELVALTNSQRSDLNLTSLNWNEQLYRAAEAKATHLLTEQYFDHISADGVTPWSFIHATGYTYRTAGENLAVGFTQNQPIVEAWMDSPTHRANIVDPDFVDIGIATAYGTLDGKEVTVVVQMFGQP